MNTLFFDLQHLIESERLTIEVLADGLAHRLSMQALFKNPTDHSRCFLFLDANAANFAKCLDKKMLKNKEKIVVLADAPLDLPPAVLVWLRPLRAKAFQDMCLACLNGDTQNLTAARKDNGALPSQLSDGGFLLWLGQLVAEHGFAAFRHGDCNAMILLHNGELGLSAPLPADFFERKPKLSLTGWQEQPWPTKQVLDNVADAQLFLAYLILSQESNLPLLNDPEQPMLLKKFPSFVFNLHFQTMWSSPVVRNQLMRAALRMQINSPDPEPCTVTVLQQKAIPQQDVKKFCNLLFLLGYYQAATSAATKPVASKKRPLASRIRQHLGLEQSPN